MDDLFSHLIPAQQSGAVDQSDQSDDPLPNAGEDMWSPSSAPAAATETAAPKADEKKSPSLGHTAGMAATDFLIRGAPEVFLGPLDVGIAAANTGAYAYDQLKPDSWPQAGRAPYASAAWQDAMTNAGVPVPESTAEEWIHPAAMGAGAAIGAAGSVARKAIGAGLGALSGAAGGIGSKVGGMAGHYAGAAAGQVLPEGQTIAGYTPAEAGEFIGSVGGGMAGAAGAAGAFPQSSKAGVDSLMKKDVPVSMGQVRGGIPGQLESGLARTNILALPSRRLGGQQDTAIDQFLYNNGGHMTEADAGAHVQNTAAEALQKIKETRNDIYKPYMDQIGDPQFYKNGKPMIGADGKPLIIYPTLQPTTSIKLAKGLSKAFKGNDEAEQNAGISKIKDVVSLLSKPMDINQAKQQIGYIRNMAQDLSNPMFQGNNRQLGAKLTQITKALQNDIAESADLAKPGAKALLKEADAKAAPTYDEEYALKPLVNVPKNESAAMRFVQATGAGKALGNADLIKSLYKYSDPAMADKLSAYLVKTLGQSDSHPSSTGLAPQLNSSAASSGINNIKANNPEVHSLLFPNDPGKQINSQFIQGVNTVGKTPLNQGIPHMGAVGAGGAGAGIIGAAEHVMEHGLTGLVPEPHTLAAMAAGATATNAASKFSTLQPLVAAYNKMPRLDRDQFLQMLYSGGAAGATTAAENASGELEKLQAGPAAPLKMEINRHAGWDTDPAHQPNMFQDLIPEGNQ